MYTNNAQEGPLNEPIKEVLTTPYDLGDVCRDLIDLMSSETYLHMDSWGFHTNSRRLLEEIELFFKILDSG